LPNEVSKQKQLLLVNGSFLQLCALPMILKLNTLEENSLD